MLDPTQDEDLRKLSQKTEELLARLDDLSGNLGSPSSQQVIPANSYDISPSSSPAIPLNNNNQPSQESSFTTTRKTAIFTEHSFSNSSQAQQYSPPPEQPPVISPAAPTAEPSLEWTNFADSNAPQQDHNKNNRPNATPPPHQPQHQPIESLQPSASFPLEATQTQRVSNGYQVMPMPLARNNFREEELRSRLRKLSQDKRNKTDALKYFAIFTPFFAFALPLTIIMRVSEESNLFFAVSLSCVCAFFSLLLSLMAWRVGEISYVTNWAQRQIVFLRSEIEEIHRNVLLQSRQ